MISTAAPKECSVKQRLRAEFKQAHAWTIGLGDRKAQAGMQGDHQTSAALVHPLKQAVAERRLAVQALMAHIASHRC